MKLLTIIATLSPMTWLRSGDPKQEANAISGFPALATNVSATQSATQLPRASTVNPRIAEVEQSQFRVQMQLAMYVTSVCFDIPVSIPRSSPSDLRTLTTSLATMYNQIMDMRNVIGTSTHWMLQWGGFFELSSRKRRAETATPVDKR